MHARVVQHLLLQRRHRLQALGVIAPPHAPAQRRRGVAAEVEPVVPVDALEQQLELEPVRSRRRSARAVGCAQRYSHTRISDSS